MFLNDLFAYFGALLKNNMYDTVKHFDTKCFPGYFVRNNTWLKQ